MRKPHKPPKVKREPITPAAPVVKKVALAPAEILHVVVPPGVAPVVAVHPAKRIVEIVPVPAKKKQSWWQAIFG